MSYHPPPFSDKILANASPYTRIQASLAALEDFPDTFASQTRRIKQLERDILKSQEIVGRCIEATKKEREGHEQMRDSTAKRLAYKLARKTDQFEQRAHIEEQEYVDALHHEMAERRHLEETEADLSAAKKQLEAYTAYKSELWTLYDNVFDGQKDPKDHELKAQIATADATYRRIARQSTSDAKIVELLAKAQAKMKNCFDKLKKAMEFTVWSAMGTSVTNDSIMLDHLKASGAAGDEAVALVHEATTASSEVHPIGDFKVAQGGRWMRMEVFFLQPLFVAPKPEEMKVSEVQVDGAYRKLKAELTSATQRAERSYADLQEAGDVVNESRSNLEMYRQSVFDMVLLHQQSGTSSSEIPPTYVQ